MDNLLYILINKQANKKIWFFKKKKIKKLSN